MATLYTVQTRPKTLPDVRLSPTKTPIADHEDYGTLGAEEFARRIQADNAEAHGALIAGLAWAPSGKAGW